MLGMAWVTLGDGRRRKAVIQKVCLVAKAEDEVGIHMSGFLLHTPEETFKDEEVVGHFTPLNGLWKALEKLFEERDGKQMLSKAHRVKRVRSVMAERHLEGLRLNSPTTFAYHA